MLCSAVVRRRAVVAQRSLHASGGIDHRDAHLLSVRTALPERGVERVERGASAEMVGSSATCARQGSAAQQNAVATRFMSAPGRAGRERLGRIEEPDVVISPCVTS
jgi:hypothetical protein